MLAFDSMGLKSGACHTRATIMWLMPSYWANLRLLQGIHFWNLLPPDLFYTGQGH